MKSKNRVNPKDRITREINDLQRGLAELEINSGRAKKFTIYLELLYKYQNKINLISYNDHDRISRRHFLVSLIAYPYLKNARHIADLGSGAGFPGVPLKIALPEKEFVLIESMQKRAKFLQELINKLELNSISVFPDRAENYHDKVFDMILLRAAGKIKDNLRLIDRLLIPGGQAIFYKSSSVDGEIKKAQSLMDKFGFSFQVEQRLTPIEKIPMSLGFLQRHSA